MKNNTSPRTIRRSDYTPPDFWLDTVELAFDLHEDRARVRSTMAFRKNPQGSGSNTLVLDGEELSLISVAIDGHELESSQFSVDESTLRISGLEGSFSLTVETECEPQNNTRLEGLYKTSGNFCTQCEAQGFRRISYFPDRPDVMARFTVDISADKSLYPVMLSNGNLLETVELENNRHKVRWQDPFPKPSYLFALVAGDLACIEDRFTTRSGRQVDLRIYVEHHNRDKCAFAMESLKKSMRWDEERFGLEYDLDIYMVVAVDDFNMGAMENKGLNVFNSKFVLTDDTSATDADFAGVESVIGHEYFHNWTGNRVTCRDWFQLSLKEGLTVFRDQEFSADLNDRAVKRIDDVRQLRARQFPEDAGPMAHPIRPDEYIEINNFYTATVYEKGAEVIRMMHTLIGEKNFRAGMDLYFERHDGQAVTCEDFVLAMEAASGVDLKQFRHWYSQAGTPTVSALTNYKPESEELHLTLKQHCNTHPENKPCHIPVKIGLLDCENGEAVAFILEGAASPTKETVLDFREAEQNFVISGVKQPAEVSLLRGFSAPVHLEQDSTDEVLAFMMQHDTDSFNRWEAGQRLAIRVIEELMEGKVSLAESTVAKNFEIALGSLLSSNTENAALRAEALILPGMEAIAELQDQVDVDLIYSAREQLRKRLAESWQEQLTELYELCNTDEFTGLNPRSVAVRRLKNACLHYLAALDENVWRDKVVSQFSKATGMTDTMAALRELTHSDLPEREEALDTFYRQWQNNRLVIDKWFAIQAMSQRENAIDDVITLTQHPDFESGNPNRVRSLVASFALFNPLRFHSLDGRGYGFLVDHVIALDKTNPQLAARLVSPLSRWRRYTVQRQELMTAELRRIAGESGLSPDVFEIVNKSLAK